MSIARKLCNDAEREAFEKWSAAYRHGVLHGLSMQLGETVFPCLYPMDSAAIDEWQAGNADSRFIICRYLWECASAGERVAIRMGSGLI